MAEYLELEGGVIGNMWIRSQSRVTLVDAKRLIVAQSPYLNDGYRVINQYVGTEDSDDYDVLGEYKTKERAIEVMDEIQKNLRNILVVNYSQCIIVYEMPEK